MRDPLYRLIYRSRNAIDGDLDEQALEIDAILDSARRNNVGRAVTGVLVVTSQHFLQVLEGPMQEISDTFETICRDMRHRDLSLLEFERIERRAFIGWAMACPASRPGAAEVDLDFAGGWDAVRKVLATLRDGQGLDIPMEFVDHGPDSPVPAG